MNESMLTPDQTDISTILIVDDMIENLRLLASILRQAGYPIRLLREGQMVLSSALQAPPDVILLDIMMPDLSGYEVCRQLKADDRTRDIPVIFLSALHDTADKVKAFAAGGADYITKPFQVEEVLARVNTHLTLRQTQRRLQDAYRREQQRRRIAETLRDAAGIVGSSLDLAQVLEAILTQLGQVVTYHHATVTTVDGDQCTVVAGRDERGQTVGRFTFPLAHYPLNVETLQTRGPVLVPDARVDPRWKPGMSQTALRSFVNAPLVARDRPIGILGVGRSDDTPYTDDDARTVFAFASQTAMALENARLYTLSRKELADRRRAEATLRKTYQLQEKIFAGLDDVILVADAQTCAIILCNPAVERMFGYQEQAVFGESIAQLFENPEMFRQVFDDLSGVLDAGDIFHAELPMRRQDGSLFLSSQHAAELVDDEGQRIGIVWIIRDVTEQRRAEHALADERNLLRTLINNIPMLIYVKDVRSRFVLANDATVASLGMSAQEDLIGKTDGDFHPVELAAQYAADERAILESGQALIDHEEPVLDAWTGEMRWLLSTKVPFYDTRGQLVGLVGMNHDITRRKAMEAQLQVLNTELQVKNAQLAELNSSKDIFFSIISHDLRGPFSLLMGQAQLLLANVGRYSQADLTTQIEKLHKFADKVQTLLENLLAWSRLQRGAMPYEPEEIALDDLMADAIDVCLSKAEHKQISLTRTPADGLMAHADYQMVSTVLRNLISNALKFTPAGGAVSVSAHARDGEIEVAVTDTGVGIAPEHLDKLFRIDAQYTQPGTAGETGTGLGLSLCKDLVEKHGGRIWVQNAETRGATFCFTLPRAADQD